MEGLLSPLTFFMLLPRNLLKLIPAILIKDSFRSAPYGDSYYSLLIVTSTSSEESEWLPWLEFELSTTEANLGLLEREREGSILLSLLSFYCLSHLLRLFFADLFE